MAKNAPDVAAVAYVLTADVGADGDNVIGGGDIDAGRMAHGEIAVASAIVIERNNTDGRVSASGGVAKERVYTAGCVQVAGSIAQERLISIGAVVVGACSYRALYSPWPCCYCQWCSD